MKRIVLASGNKGKLREFRQMLSDDLISVSELIEDFDVEESANSFAGNAMIKAKSLYDRLEDDYIVISDDSGISVPILGGEPGIYSARYAGEGATDRDNLIKLVDRLKEIGVDSTDAYYTAAIAIVSKDVEYVVHGWMYGRVVVESRGDKGFGYDPIFIPDGFDKTLGELDSNIKSKISHRAKALELAIPIIEMLRRR